MRTRRNAFGSKKELQQRLADEPQMIINFRRGDTDHEMISQPSEWELLFESNEDINCLNAKKEQETHYLKLETDKSDKETSCTQSTRTYSSSAFNHNELSDLTSERDSKTISCYKTMLVGTTNSKKYTLLSSVFSEEDPKEEYESKQGFDYCCKYNESEFTLNKYEFWIKDQKAANEPSESTSEIFKVYYKNCKTFVFLCNSNDSDEDLERLSNTMAEIKSSVEESAFQGALVIDYQGEEYDEDEVPKRFEALKEKFGLEFCFQTSLESETCDEVLDVIQMTHM